MKINKSFILKVLIGLMIFMILVPTQQAFAGSNTKREIPDFEVTKEGTVKTKNEWMNNGGGDGKVWTNILTEYRNVITGVSGIAALTMIAVFIINLMKLASSSTNPSARTQATTGILWSGIATVGLGAVTLFVGFFYNAI